MIKFGKLWYRHAFETKTKTMKRKNTLASLAICTALLIPASSCDDVLNNIGLSPERVVEGLKQALVLGTNSAAGQLSLQDGFYLDMAAKIFLPQEADKLLAMADNDIFKQLGITAKIKEQTEAVILSVNRSAEDASKEVAPIFKSAITGLNITDGLDILNGIVPAGSLKAGGEAFDSTAATKYLELSTLAQLVGVFAPKLNNSLDKPLVSGVSANNAWGNLQKTYNEGVSKYNQLMDFKATSLQSPIGGFINNISLPSELSSFNLSAIELAPKMQIMNISLAEHCTDRAISAVFGKIKIKEKEIRKDPFAFGDKLIEDVFGSVFKQQ
jgi:hypothetical protein